MPSGAGALRSLGSRAFHRHSPRGAGGRPGSRRGMRRCPPSAAGCRRLTAGAALPRSPSPPGGAAAEPCEAERLPGAAIFSTCAAGALPSAGVGEEGTRRGELSGGRGAHGAVGGSPRGVGVLLATPGAARRPPARRAEGRGSGRRAGRRCHGDGRVSSARSGAGRCRDASGLCAAEGRNGSVTAAESRSHGPSAARGCALATAVPPRTGAVLELPCGCCA